MVNPVLILAITVITAVGGFSAYTLATGTYFKSNDDNSNVTKVDSYNNSQSNGTEVHSINSTIAFALNENRNIMNASIVTTKFRGINATAVSSEPDTNSTETSDSSVESTPDSLESVNKIAEAATIDTPDSKQESVQSANDTNSNEEITTGIALCLDDTIVNINNTDANTNNESNSEAVQNTPKVSETADQNLESRKVLTNIRGKSVKVSARSGSGKHGTKSYDGSTAKASLGGDGN